MGRYRFNREQLKFVEDKRNLKGWVKRVVKYVVASILLAIVYYLVVSVFLNTEQERRLARENKLMEQEFERLQEKIVVLDNTVQNLRTKDREIYKQIFNSEPPALSHGPNGGGSFFGGIDTTRNDKIIEYSRDKIGVLKREIAVIDHAIEVINTRFAQLEDSVLFIPSIVPIRDFSIGQTGASVGQKINPFYKSVAMHNGIDLLGAMGTEILAPAAGTVEFVSRKGKKEGNTIVINHGNGYVTKYMQVGDILVREGQKVSQGNVIGRVGSSGMSFAPHLHYEILYKGKVMDPVNYFFADLTPTLFKELVAIASNTGQSLD
ncbi:MAG: M23 family metallopeptidase [Bacteroidales bacterium]